MMHAPVTAARSRPPASGHIRRTVALAVVIVFVVVVQSTILSRLTVLGVVPQVALLVVVAVAAGDGRATGAAVGFFAGLLHDLLTPGSIAGMAALVYGGVGYGCAAALDAPMRLASAPPALVVAGATAAGEAAYLLLAVMLGQPWPEPWPTVRTIALVMLYNVLLAPFVLPVIAAVTGRLRSQRVAR